MARTKKQRKQKSTPPPPLPKQDETPQVSAAQSLRETVESIVIAFVLAFLFRTFEAEAFVIPTGSMAPTLMGRHKDVFCSECGERFQINVSEEQSDEVKEARAALKMMRKSGHDPRDYRDGAAAYRLVENAECLAGVCPICRHTMTVSDNLPDGVPERRTGAPLERERSFAGDRILVNKYIYSFAEPQRWDVIVFKFPGNAQQNYIKRLVGLPSETLRIYQGDLFVAEGDAPDDAAFEIARKPPGKVHAMRQLVHDTDHDSAILYNAGWPLRWNAAAEAAGGWEITREPGENTVRQRFASDPKSDEVSWIRYQHFIPHYETWLEVEGVAGGRTSALADPKPQLVTDFNAYNARVNRGDVMLDSQNQLTLRTRRDRLGLHWVGDLTLETNLSIKSPGGELLLDLVEGGKHFTCGIDLETGKAALKIEGLADFAPTATTCVKEPGRYRLALANVDDQLLLWVDDELVEFDHATTYDADAVYGARRSMRPQSTPADPGDLAPAGVAAPGADLVIERLRLYRDIYYIATSWRPGEGGGSQPVTDIPGFGDPNQDYDAFFSEPRFWDKFLDRRNVQFELGDDQFFVMGDNSPESLDARLWRGGQGRNPGLPGGAYLERDKLVGKALCVYWPHSWYHIPRTPIPLFPNFGDMRLVR